MFTGSTSTFNGGTIESGAHPVYSDKTDLIIEATPGTTLLPTISWTGEWMHGYIYVDYNRDKEFDQTLNATGATGGETVSYTYYQGKNSLGATTANNSRLSNVPAFTLPSEMENGDYRLRVKIDWDSLDPCGNPTQPVAANGGSIVDFTLRITGGTSSGVEDENLSASSVYATENGLFVAVEGTNVVDVYDVSGRKIKSEIVNDSQLISLPAGVYIVNVAGITTKVVIK